MAGVLRLQGWGNTAERVGEAGWDALRVSALRRIRVWPPGFPVPLWSPSPRPGAWQWMLPSPHCGCALRSWPGFPRLRGQVLREKGPLDTPGAPHLAGTGQAVTGPQAWPAA